MKTLDEVITELEDEGVFPDALHYLKEYKIKRERIMAKAQDCEDTEKRLQEEIARYQEAVKNCEQAENKYKALEMGYIRATADIEDNPALSWDNLCLMVGKPVWIEYDNHLEGRKRTKYKDWEVIDCILDDMCIVKDDFDYHKSELGKTWQAYRKERE